MKKELSSKVEYKNMSFGVAIEMARTGYKIAREGWNGKDMWVVYIEGYKGPSNNEWIDELIGDDTPFEALPCFAMFTADKKWLCGWLASQTDMLAIDWFVVNPPEQD